VDIDRRRTAAAGEGRVRAGSGPDGDTCSTGAAGVTGVEPPDLLRWHLREWAGWPPARPVRVVGNPNRGLPGWDGRSAPVAGVVTDRGAAAVGLPPEVATLVPPGIELDALLGALPRLLGLRGRAGLGAFRWTTAPTPGPDEGSWLPVTDPRVPPWLYPFGGEVLVALSQNEYVAGVGIKRHDRFGHELAVVTHERARGRGLARRLVAQAARRVLDEGAVPTYLHAPDNAASAAVASAAGFPDLGWQVVGLFARPPG
jgi:GNAT superfamily N-acetyltransferase